MARQGKYDEAIQAYDRALKQQPGMPDALANRAAVDAARKRKSQQGQQGPQGQQDQKGDQGKPESSPPQAGKDGQPQNDGTLHRRRRRARTVLRHLPSPRSPAVRRNPRLSRHHRRVKMRASSRPPTRPSGSACARRWARGSRARQMENRHGKVRR
ncbi:tetratricopeptide repeat protein [Stenotrophomonas pictorum]|uniref:tetratricopeptide repeat protein n=1 Tax=Stenotrophomonas pictorum TaxID=86184 RepID=UPI003CCD20CD